MGPSSGCAMRARLPTFRGDGPELWMCHAGKAFYVQWRWARALDVPCGQGFLRSVAMGPSSGCAMRARLSTFSGDGPELWMCHAGKAFYVQWRWVRALDVPCGQGFLRSVAMGP